MGNDIPLGRWFTQFDYLVQALVLHATDALWVILALWLIHGLNYLSHYRLNHLGILPRSARGLVGILFSPFLHGDVEHLLFNSLPLFVLLDLLWLRGTHQVIQIVLAIQLLSGALVWLFARRAYHIGASAVLCGLWSFLLVGAIRAPGIMTVVVAILCIYYVGGLGVTSWLSFDRSSSWEGHFFGFVAGLVVALAL